MHRRFAAAVTVASFAIAGCAAEPPTESVSTPPDATPISDASIPASSPPSPAPGSAGVPLVHDGPLPAGRYRLSQWDTTCSEGQPGCSPSPAHDAIGSTITVPDGWAGVDGSIWLDEIGNGAPDGAGLLIGRGAWLLTDPCTKAGHVVAPDVEVGPRVEDFANALAEHPLLDVTDPVDVTLAGYSGKYVDLQVPADISMCDVYRPFDPGLFAQGPGHQWHLWILDVDGLRFVVQSTDYAGTSAQHRSDLAAIVESIEIEP